MMAILRLWGTAMGAFLDFSVGVFMIVATSYPPLRYHPTLLQLLLGGLIAVAPDFDVLYAIIKRGETRGNRHEMITHRPLIMLPLAAFTGFLLGESFWAIAAFFCLL